MALDIIGKLYDITGDHENPTVTELEGWHVNSTRPVAGLASYLVEPTPPRQVFAGVKTHCYMFSSESEAKELLGFSDGQYNPNYEPEPLPVPQQVTRRQAITVLSLGGYLPQIEAALNAIEDATQKTIAEIFWKESQQFERYNPTLIALAHAIGLTDEQLDNLFRQAANY